jgi:Domain of unknown function (DUF4148)
LSEFLLRDLAVRLLFPLMEMNMKTRLVAALFVLGTAAIPALAASYGQPMASSHTAASSGADATAQSSSGAPAYSAPVAANAGKTRAQVIHELVDAEHAGLVTTGREDYPPSEATIMRNRVRYASVTASAN